VNDEPGIQHVGSIGMIVHDSPGGPAYELAREIARAHTRPGVDLRSRAERAIDRLHLPTAITIRL
jgi:hypothetical protein